MTDRSIKNPAGKGSMTVQSIAAEAAVLRAERESIDSARPSSSAKKRTPNAAFMNAMTPSPALAAIIGSKPMPRDEVTRKLWSYIRANKLQDSAQKTVIHADKSLKQVFKKAQVSMFEMTKLLNGHLK